MNSNNKDRYVAPETFSVKVVSEHFICSSEITDVTGDRLDYGEPGDEIIW